MDYPKRPPFFAHKFTRLLMKSCAAMDIGQHSCLLLVHIAHIEDAGRYRGPARFWNEQLESTLALSPRQLRSARDKAIEFGWLVYWRETDRTVGRYFVTVPESAQGLSDDPIEEPSGATSCAPSGADLNIEMNIEMNNKAPSKRTRSEHQSVPPSNPIPNPIPNPKEEHSANAAPPQWQEMIRETFDATFGTSSRITASRSRALNARWRDSWWKDNWKAALERAGPSAFLRGANDRGWVIDFEFFLRPDTATKILEGKYDDRQGTKVSSAQARENSNADAFDAFDAAVERSRGQTGYSGGTETPLLT